MSRLWITTTMVMETLCQVPSIPLDLVEIMTPHYYAPLQRAVWYTLVAIRYLLFVRKRSLLLHRECFSHYWVLCGLLWWIVIHSRTKHSCLFWGWDRSSDKEDFNQIFHFNYCSKCSLHRISWRYAKWGEQGHNCFSWSAFRGTSDWVLPTNESYRQVGIAIQLPSSNPQPVIKTQLQGKKKPNQL